ncbi:putative mitochondrial 2-oxoglutarate/malate carrier protein [Armadillidium nasatum]|uniref:Putative mitochondrial 2-oxoglutarate/malate carrier protein n=1 Tax=Armadillidium nasatum TaxID=96803 RepID=A0A5N5T711_9CRUS|nr:putative mitochondrial 2-oxoglutarate/malate carrier protein [Armadillidium nasatum]
MNDLVPLYPRNSWQSTLVGAFTSGFFLATCMSPFDVIATRVYNQALDSSGRNLVYRGVFDCFMKILKAEGIYGFYKGWSAVYLRVGPHICRFKEGSIANGRLFLISQMNQTYHIFCSFGNSVLKYVLFQG